MDKNISLLLYKPSETAYIACCPKVPCHLVQGNGLYRVHYINYFLISIIDSLQICDFCMKASLLFYLQLCFKIIYVVAQDNSWQSISCWSVPFLLFESFDQNSFILCFKICIQLLFC